MPYLNLDVNYFNHIKTLRLVGLLGRGAAELPIRLWTHCGANIAKAGSLSGYSAQEIESLVGWWGKSGEFVDAMMKVGFLEKARDGFKIHDWDDHEGHMISYHLRAKEAARKRWGSYATSMPQALLDNKLSNAPAVQCSAVPARPKKLQARARFIKPAAAEVGAYAKTIGFPIDGNAFVDHYESCGWVIGKARKPMQDWKAAVREWKRRQGDFDRSSGATPAPRLGKFVENKPPEEEIYRPPAKDES